MQKHARQAKIARELASSLSIPSRSHTASTGTVYTTFYTDWGELVARFGDHHEADVSADFAFDPNASDKEVRDFVRSLLDEQEVERILDRAAEERSAYKEEQRALLKKAAEEDWKNIEHLEKTVAKHKKRLAIKKPDPEAVTGNDRRSLMATVKSLEERILKARTHRL